MSFSCFHRKKFEHSHIQQSAHEHRKYQKHKELHGTQDIKVIGDIHFPLCQIQYTA